MDRHVRCPLRLDSQPGTIKRSGGVIDALFSLSIGQQNKQNVLPTIANVQRLMADNAKSFKASASMVANLVDGNNAATWYQPSAATLN